MTTPFADILGQDEAILQLQQAWTAGRLPHAMLFVGPNGVGRRTTALALAGAMLCSQPVEAPTDELVRAGHDPLLRRLSAIRQGCGQCQDCRMTSRDTHPDLHLVYKELAQYHDDSDVRDRKMQDLGIDVIRQFLIGAAGRVSSRGRGRVFIVLDAELMSTEAQNALLKTLEEPPAGVTILLIAQSPQQLLPTAVSRCTQVRFGRLSHDLVRRRLLEQGLAPQQANFWAVFSEGSLGEAMELSGQGLYELKCELVDELAKLGPAGNVGWGQQLHERSEKLADQIIRQARRATGVELAKTVAARQAATLLLRLLGGAYRDALALAHGSQRPLANADQRGQVEALVKRFPPGQLAEMIEQLATYEQLLWRNVNLKLLCDNVAVTCASAAPLRLGGWA
jgi:DNA polymerase-3 subunit delta'